MNTDKSFPFLVKIKPANYTNYANKNLRIGVIRVIGGPPLS